MTQKTHPVENWPLLTIEISSDVIFQDLDGETVLLDMKTGHYYGLDEVSTRIWQLMSARNTLQDILVTLVKEYAVGKERCCRDIRTFLQSLEEKNLITVHPSKP